MKMMTIILLFGIIGCSFAIQNFNDRSLKDIQYGMTKDQISNIFGKATQEKTIVMDRKKYEVWTYPKTQKIAGKFKVVGQTYCEIYFIDGKVKSWELIKVISKPSYEFEKLSPPDDATVIEIRKK